jgi:hypothetical protein
MVVERTFSTTGKPSSEAMVAASSSLAAARVSTVGCHKATTTASIPAREQNAALAGAHSE